MHLLARAGEMNAQHPDCIGTNMNLTPQPKSVGPLRYDRFVKGKGLGDQGLVEASYKAHLRTFLVYQYASCFGAGSQLPR